MRQEDLEQYRSICAEIQEINVKLKDSTIYGVVRGSDNEFPYTQHTMNVQGVTSTKDNIKLLATLDSLTKKKDDIEIFVNEIEDSMTRRIFRYRYITGKRRLSWQAIAFKIGECDEQYPRRKHNNFLRKLKIDENDEF